MKKEIKFFIGTWSIVEMEAWDQDFVNMEVVKALPQRLTLQLQDVQVMQIPLQKG